MAKEIINPRTIEIIQAVSRYLSKFFWLLIKIMLMPVWVKTSVTAMTSKAKPKVPNSYGADEPNKRATITRRNNDMPLVL